MISKEIKKMKEWGDGKEKGLNNEKKRKEENQ